MLYQLREKNTPRIYQNFAELLYTQAFSKTFLVFVDAVNKTDVVSSCHTHFQENRNWQEFAHVIRTGWKCCIWFVQKEREPVMKRRIRYWALAIKIVLFNPHHKRLRQLLFECNFTQWTMKKLKVSEIHNIFHGIYC